MSSRTLFVFLALAFSVSTTTPVAEQRASKEAAATARVGMRLSPISVASNRDADLLPNGGGLVASYPFNGNAEDASGNGNHGVVQGAVLTTDRFGEANRAYRFDGVSSAVEVGALPVPFAGAFTISYWEESAVRTRMHALSVGQSSGTNLDFDFNDQNGNSYGLWAYWNGSGENRVWTETVRGGGFTDGIWHHVVLRRSGVRVELFVDGRLQGGTDYAGTIAGPGPLRIGRGSYNTAWWQGKVDDVQIYSRALDDTEIATLSEDRPALRVLSPNGGEVWQTGSLQDIRWVVDERVAAVKLEYSGDDGATWQTIVASTPMLAGRYAWNVADVRSNQCRVRVSDVAEEGHSDVSDAVFVILRGSGGLVASYPFNGNAEDASGNGNHGVVQGAVLTTDRFGSPASAYFFSGGSRYIEVPSLPIMLSSNFTISYWEESAVRTRMHALSVGQSSGTNLDFDFNDQFGNSYGLWAYWNGSGGNRVWTETVRGGGFTDGRWHYVVLRRSGVRVELFVDGALQGGTDYAGTVAGPGPLRIGRGSYNTAWWQGKVDDVQIYSRALDDTEIATLSEDRPALRVLSPNGGEVWQTGSLQDISWVVDERVAAVKLEYSGDDGATWQTIVASTPMLAGRYAWNVADVRSNQCRVRVSDVAGEGHSDVSDAAFEIDNRPVLKVLSPNGGEVWQTGSLQDISWVVDERVAAVKLEYSGDDGATWQTIVASTPMLAGRYAWNVADVRSNQCRVRVSDVAGEGHSDVSDAAFEIDNRPVLKVLSPNGGEVWQTGGPPQDIRWVVDERVAAVKLEYSGDDGATWQTIVASTPMLAGRYAWNVADVRSNQCRVRVSDVAGEGHSDVSDAVFVILRGSGGLVASYPFNGNAEDASGNGNHGVVQGAVLTTDRFGEANRAYRFDGVSSAVEVGALPVPFAGAFTISYWEESAVRTRMHALSVGQSSGTNLDFDFNGQDGGNSYGLWAYWNGSGENRVWTETVRGGGFTDGIWHHVVLRRSGVRVELFVDGRLQGGTDYAGTIGEPGPLRIGRGSDNTEWWQGVLDDVQIYNRALDDTEIATLSEDRPALRVLSPNGGEVWQTGSLQDISWVVDERVAAVKLEYSGDDGATWQTIVASTPMLAGRYAWNVADVRSSQCRVRVSDVAGEGHSDVSDAAFEIDNRPVLKVLSPNGGEVWQTGGPPQDIRWVVDERVAAVKLEYSGDDGATWQTIVASTPMLAGRYAWNVADVRSNQCRVRVSDVAGEGHSDVSDAAFEIDNRPVLKVLSPNGGEVWQTGSLQDIRWVVDERVAAVKLEYSGDDGATWQTIVASTPMLAGRYAWNVADVRSNQCRVRVSDVAGEGHSDVSDAAFEIDNRPVLKVLSPNGGEVWQTGSLQDISWVVDERVAAVKLEYSGDDGATWQTIVASTPMLAGRYAWNVADVRSNQCRVRVSDVAGEGHSDVSDAAFEIDNRPVLKVLSPNGGEVWQTGGPPQDIRWVVDERVAAVKLEYSGDDGATWQTIVASTPMLAGRYAWNVADVRSNQCRVRVSDVAGEGHSDVSDAVFVILRGSGGLVASYPFNGNAEDASGNGNHGVVQGAVLTTDRFGEANRAYRFDGVSSAVEVGALPVPFAGAFTISYWEESAVRTRMHALSVGQSSGTNLDFNFNGQDGGNSYGLWAYWNGSGENRVWTETVRGGGFTDGIWHHVVLRRSGVRVELFVDGRLQGGTDYAGTIGEPGPLRIGRGSDNTEWWQGVLDDVQIYNRALDDTEIATLSEDRPALRVLSPNGGEVWQTGSLQDISWVVDERVAAVKLEYSGDDGATWQTIVASTPMLAGRYAWNVADVRSSQCRVRVSDVGDEGHSDVSDAVFVILRGSGGLVASYPFNGNAEDASGNGNHGVVQGAVLTTDRFGSPASAYFFSGGSRYIEVPSLPIMLSSNFTISYWEESAVRTRMHALSVGQSSGTNLDFDFNDQFGNSYGLWAYWNGSGGNRVWTETVRGGGFTDGRWHYVVLRRSGVRVELFVDGALQGGTDYAGTIAGPGPLRIGRGSYNTAWWQGKVDDVQIYSRALDNTEIAALSSDRGNRASMVLSSPAGGESWQGESTHDITWNADAGVSALRLEYSIDDGGTWQTIVDSTPAAAGRFAWVVPNLSSARCLVRLSDAAGVEASVDSAATFSIFAATEQWTLVTPHAAFEPRDGAGALVFNGYMWLLGGYPLNENGNEVWRSADGANWQLVARAPWPPRHAGGYVVYDNQMWVIGGDGNTDVWHSSDGITWTLGTAAAPWGKRYKPYVLSYDNKIWLMGGLDYFDGNYLPYNDVWNTTDGIQWTRVTEHAAWAPRGLIHGGVVFNGKMWLMGGGLYGPPPNWHPEVYYNDVWNSTNGIDWQLVTAHAPWLPRMHHSTFVYADRLWVLAGHDYDLYGTGLKNDVWISPDGTNWQQLPESPWSPRHAASVFVFNDVVWLAAGFLVNDVWRLQRAGNITIANGAAFTENSLVNLTLSAPDLAVDEMQLSNDGVNWSASSSYSTQSDWTLSPGDGIKTVYVRFRSAQGAWSDSYQDTIEYSSAPYLRLTAPTGGESWQTTNAYDITWTVGTRVTNVKLEYSLDGDTWTEIVSSTAAAAGRYTWTVPDHPSRLALVRVSDAADASVASQSLESFTIFRAIDGLVASYPFDGDALDLSGNDNHGTVYGATLAADRFGQSDKAYEFDGTGAYIEIGRLATSLAGDFTISFWEMSHQSRGMHALSLSNSALDNLDFDFNQGSDSLIAYWNSTGAREITQALSNGSLTDGVWHEIVLRRKDSEIELLVDGTSRGVTTYRGPVGSRVPLRIGRGSYDPNWWSGFIDDVRIYNRALSNAEVTFLSNDR